MSPQIPISFSTAAEAKHCSLSAISRALRGALAPAFMPPRDIDSKHPAFVNWRPMTSKARSQKAQISTVDAPPAAAEKETEVPPDFTNLMQLTLAQICEHWGSLRGLERALVSKKLSAEIERIQVRNDRDSQRVISTAAVKHFVFSYLETLNMKLLRNAATTIESRISAMARSESTAEERLAVVRDLLSADMGFTKRVVARALRHRCRATDTPSHTEIEEQHGNEEDISDHSDQEI